MANELGSGNGEAAKFATKVSVGWDIDIDRIDLLLLDHRFAR